jgi:hypothetical protein
MWCAWMFPQFRGREAGAVTVSGRVFQCLAVARWFIDSGCVTGSRKALINWDVSSRQYPGG